MMKQSNQPKIILASSSPRRRELLSSLDLEFQVISPDFDEASVNEADYTPDALVSYLASCKAKSIAKNHPDTVVIGADTIVVIDGTVLGKPKDKKQAFEMLDSIQGKTHTVYSGIAVCYQDRIISDCCGTQVTMHALDADQISRYVETGEPMDKAGAYAIQGYGSLIVKEIDGCYFNVVGMSLQLLNQLLSDFELRLL